MYAVNLSNKAQKGYKTYTEYRTQFQTVLTLLETNSHPFHTFDLAKLKGLPDSYRIRIGKMRIKYRIIAESKTIVVFYIGPRETAYD